jgi:hypothetical protein
MTVGSCQLTTVPSPTPSSDKPAATRSDSANHRPAVRDRPRSSSISTRSGAFEARSAINAHNVAG